MFFRIFAVICFGLMSNFSFGQGDCECAISISEYEKVIFSRRDSLQVFPLINKYKASSNMNCIYEALVLEFEFYYTNKNSKKVLESLKEQERMLNSMHCDETPYVFDFQLNKIKYFRLVNDYENLSEFAFKALKQSEKLKDSKREIKAIKEIVYLFTRMDEDQKNWNYIKRAQELILKGNNTIESFENYRWLAYEYENKYTTTGRKSLLDSLYLFVNIAKTGAQKHKTYDVLAQSYRALEAYSYHRGELQNALKYIDSAIFYAKKIKGIKNMSGLYLSKAWDHLDLGQKHLAVKWMDTSFANIISNDVAAIMMQHLDASDLYEQAGRQDKAFASFKTYAKLKDSILNAERITVINDLEAKYKTEVKDAQIKRLIMLLIIAAFLIVVLLFVGKMIQLKRTRQKNEALKLAFEKQLELERELADVRDEIAQDFHDDLGNKLARISLLSSLVSGEVTSKAPDVKSKIKQITEDANGLYNGTRDFIFSLKSRSEYLEEVVTYLSDFGQDYFRKTSIKFKIEKSIDANVKLPHYWNRHLVYIFKEAMTNALKHAQCTSVTLRVNFKTNLLQMDCIDDGKGLSDDHLKSSNGMYNMKYRAQKIGGELKVNSIIDKGTTISFTGKTKL